MGAATREKYMGSRKNLLTDEMIGAVAAKFRLLGEPARLKLLHRLEGGECAVNELAVAIGSSQPNASRHLNALFDGGLLNRRRDGSNIYYSIADPIVIKLCATVCDSIRTGIRDKLKALDHKNR